MIALSRETENAVRAEGEKAYPSECCGFLLGQVDEQGQRNIVEILPITNSSEQEEQYHRFRIEPDDFMRVERKAGARGLSVVGFYHSHPDHEAVPSDYDREHALPYYSYVIVAVSNGKAQALTSWELSLDRVHFNQELQGEKSCQ